MTLLLNSTVTRAAAGALLGLTLGIASAPASATQQDVTTLRAHAEQFLKRQSADLPGEVSVTVRQPRVDLPACGALESFLPVGGRRMGAVSVGVRCLAPSAWTVYLSAQVKVVGHYAVTLQALPANHALTASDVALREGDLGALPADVATDLDSLLGYRTVAALAAGAAVRTAVVRPPVVVQQGQTTRVILNGPGFSVQSEGQALANASRGDRVRVKTRSGQVISGIAAEGQQVMVAF